MEENKKKKRLNLENFHGLHVTLDREDVAEIEDNLFNYSLRHNLSTPIESYDSIWGNLLIFRVVGSHSVLTGESTGCRGKSPSNLSARIELQLPMRARGLVFLFISKCKWDPEPVVSKWHQLHWALVYVLFGKYWPEQQQQKNFNAVNSWLSRPQVECCKTNDR